MTQRMAERIDREQEIAPKAHYLGPLTEVLLHGFDDPLSILDQRAPDASA
jgi:hypothetical protein